jgi:hypothetical protein
MTKHFDQSHAKSAPLVANVPVVKSAKLPAKLEWRAFDDFARIAQSLAGRWNDDKDKWVGVDNPHTYKSLVKFFAAVQAFNRPEFYQETELRPNLLDCWTPHQIRRDVVSDQIGLLIGGFPNGTPNSPEVYTKLMIEEIVAANPSMIALEATCRKIRRTKKFLPAIVEVLDILREQAAWWSDTWEAMCSLDEYLAGKLGHKTIPCFGWC